MAPASTSMRPSADSPVPEPSYAAPGMPKLPGSSRERSTMPPARRTRATTVARPAASAT